MLLGQVGSEITAAILASSLGRIAGLPCDALVKQSDGKPNTRRKKISTFNHFRLPAGNVKYKRCEVIYWDSMQAAAGCMLQSIHRLHPK